MEHNKKRHFQKLPYSELYVLTGDKPYPKIFIDDIEGMVYIYSHDSVLEGSLYYGVNFD